MADKMADKLTLPFSVVSVSSVFSLYKTLPFAKERSDCDSDTDSD